MAPTFSKAVAAAGGVVKPTGRSEYSPQLVVDAATRYGHDPELLKRQMLAESDMNGDGLPDIDAVSPVGAGGPMQIMPDTARKPGYGVKPISDAERFDPAISIDFGANYMAQLKKEFGSDRAALVAYNWGPGNAKKWVANGSRDEDLPRETRMYVKRIMDGYTPSDGAAAPAAGGGKTPTFSKAIAARGGAAPAAPAGEGVVNVTATRVGATPDGAPAAAFGAGPTPLETATASREDELANGPRPQRETATATAVVVPAIMQTPPTEKELEAVAGYPADTQPYVFARSRGLDHDQAAAYAEQLKARAEAEEAAARPERSGGDPYGGRTGLMRQLLPGGIPFIDSEEDQAAYAELQEKNSKGRLATLLGGATLGLADDAVGLVAPETAEDMRVARSEYAKENPLSSAIVTLMGGAAPAGALNAGLRRAGAAGIPVVSPSARALTSFETAAGLGPKLRNALRIGGQGAILGGVDSTGNGGSFLTGAAVGGVAGALLGPAAEQVVKGARALLASPAAKAIRALSSRLGESATSLSRRWAHFTAVTGRPPSIAEIADRELAQELAALGKVKKGAERIFSDAERAADRARPQNLADEITGDAIPAPLRREGMGGPTSNVGDEVMAQRARMDDEMVRIGGTPVPVTGDEFQRFMSSPEIQRAARNDPNLRRAMARAAEDFAAAGDDAELAAELVSNAFTVRDMEGLRQLLRAEQARAVEGGLGNIGDQYRRMSEDTIDIASAEVPRYGAALRRFGEDSRRITGLREGEAGRTARDAGTVDLRRDLTTPEGRAGNVEGLRGRLVDDALESERSAETLARRLTETGTDEARTLREAFGRDESRRLERVGRVETRAAENMRLVARGVSPTERQNLDSIAANVAETVALGGSQATLWFKVRQGVKLLRAIGMPADRARRIATMTTVPGRSRSTVDALLEEGLTETQIRQFFNQYGGNAGVTAGEMTQKRRRRRVADED